MQTITKRFISAASVVGLSTVLAIGSYSTDANNKMEGHQPQYDLTAGSADLLYNPMEELTIPTSGVFLKFEPLLSGLPNTASIQAQDVPLSGSAKEDDEEQMDEEPELSQEYKDAHAEELTFEEVFHDMKVKQVSYTRYAKTTVNMREYPMATSKSLGTFTVNKKVFVKGEVPDSNFVEVKYKGNRVYVDKRYLSKTKIKIRRRSTGSSSPAISTLNNTWTGSVLSRQSGVNRGPSGRETYYNLDMSGVIRIMRRMGNNDPYWVRADGVKMLGSYVMIAADLTIRPRGSHVQTSLGMGVVCDSGTFIYSNHTQIDIATTW